jgi:hypothetical protein
MSKIKQGVVLRGLDRANRRLGYKKLSIVTSDAADSRKQGTGSWISRYLIVDIVAQCVCNDVTTTQWNGYY